ncbi:MAG TPA: cytochrome c-type biogenesis protein CcmH [Actinomycetota bacterium]|nr:cytochrome c-type biogenesis protein CcmH [Actinomycetota bacterium]
MSKTAALLLVCLVAAAAAVTFVVADPRGPATFDERVDRIASTLRCPVCESLSVKDSTADVAMEMRDRIAEDLRAGRSPEEIKAGFVRAYGETVLLTPEPRGINLIAWLVPVVALVGGGAAAAALVRRWSAPEGSAA